MHGLGNDFIILESLGEKLGSLSSFEDSFGNHITSSFAQKLCDRRLGIGADQILWIKRPTDLDADVCMEIINADGSIAEMCGNGIRAVAIYLNKYTNLKKLNHRIETLAGIKSTSITNKKKQEVQVEMGVPEFLELERGARKESLFIDNQKFYFYKVSIGNPHAVIFIDSLKRVQLKELPLQDWGPCIETHPNFPNRTNVEFVEIQDKNTICVRVWERGAGSTLACGTGACASAVMSIATKRTESPVSVYLPGGRLKISWAGIGSPVFMSGPATEVFSGSFKVSL